MFTVATGRLVHQAETLNELLLAAMTNPAPPLSSVLPQFPPPLAAVIDRALAYDFNTRWPNARAMQAALRQAHETMQRVAAPVNFKAGGTMPMPQFSVSDRSPAPGRAGNIAPAAGRPPGSGGGGFPPPGAGSPEPLGAGAATAQTLLARPSEPPGPMHAMPPHAAEPSGLMRAPAGSVPSAESSGLIPAPALSLASESSGLMAAPGYNAPFGARVGPIPGHAVATAHPVTMAGMVPERGRTMLSWAIVAGVIVTTIGLVAVLVFAWRTPTETTPTPSPAVAPVPTEPAAPVTPPSTQPSEVPVPATASAEPPVPAASSTESPSPTPTTRTKTKGTGQPRKERDLLNRQH
jgi:serine/threonine-protein kinase